MNKKNLVPFIGIVGFFVSIFAVAEINTTQTMGSQNISSGISITMNSISNNGKESFDLYGRTTNPPGTNGPQDCPVGTYRCGNSCC